MSKPSRRKRKFFFFRGEERPGKEWVILKQTTRFIAKISLVFIAVSTIIVGSLAFVIYYYIVLPKKKSNEYRETTD